MATDRIRDFCIHCSREIHLNGSAWYHDGTCSQICSGADGNVMAAPGGNVPGCPMPSNTLQLLTKIEMLMEQFSTAFTNLNAARRTLDDAKKQLAGARESISYREGELERVTQELQDRRRDLRELMAEPAPVLELPEPVENQLGREG